MAVYALVDSAGAIVRRQAFDVSPGALAPSKGLRWLPDAPPVVDLWQVATAVERVPADAAEISYTVADRSLDEVKAETRAAISAKRDATIASGVTVQKPSDSATFLVQTRDETDLRNVAGVGSVATAQKQLGATGTIIFRDADNVDHELSYDDAQSMALQVAARITAVYRNSWAHKDAVGALATAQAAYQYDFSGGW